MIYLLLINLFLAYASIHKNSINSTDNYVIKEITSIFEFTKKIIHMNNALFTDMLMLCNRKLNDVTNQTW